MAVNAHVPVNTMVMRSANAVAAVASAFLTAPGAVGQSRPAVLFLFYYGGKILWMLLARRLAPLDYRLAMLRGTRDQLSTADAWLARTLWGTSGSE